MSSDSTDAVDAQNSHHSGVYETRYQKSLRHYLTREALPQESHYRNLNSLVSDATSRPTLADLHNATLHQKTNVQIEEDDDDPAKPKRGKVIKFGWLKGVYMVCLLNIWGVMLFLRLSWVVGEAGIIFGVIIVLLANAITIVTSLSMSAVATNGQIKAGGIYYMISRSLGPEFGGSIGLLITLANSIAAATYIIGFVNALQDMIADYAGVTEIIPGAGGGTNDARILGVVTLILVLALAIVGMDWVARVQMALLFLLIGAQVDFIVGAFMGPKSDEDRAQGYVGLTGEVFSNNLMPDYRYMEGEQSFFTVFGVFFPAVTGIVAGANLSGDLKDPGEAIPKGTLLAIFTTLITYIIYPILIGGAVVRDATGNITDYSPEGNSVYENPAYQISTCGFDDTTGEAFCEYGLQNSFQVMEMMSAWGPLIYIGCFAATLSSAIASLVGAPRVLQALAKDRLYPLIHVFEVGCGANNDPVRGYLLVFVISFACVMIGELNAVSSLLTNFFIASYALINFSCFHASLIKSPGWRPFFKWYNKWVSLFGGLMCLIVMFLIDWTTALITFIATVVLYMYVQYRKPDVNWGSSTQAQTYVSALKTALDLVSVEEHVKNYRPQILLLSGNPASRPILIDFANSLTKNISFLACANIVKDPLTQTSRSIATKKAYSWFSKHKIRAFYSVVEATDFEEGTKFLYQLEGLGKLRPNMILLGYKSNWNQCDRNELKLYFNTLHGALNMYLGIAILRVPSGLDYSHVLEEDTLIVPNKKGAEGGQMQKDGHLSELSTHPGSPSAETGDANAQNKDKKPVAKRNQSMASLYHGIGGVELPKDVVNNLTMFKKKQKGTIDVWWLYDDGGLTLLLPYILSTRSQWSSCKLRVFALANRKHELDMEQRSMANLLSKFRIDFSDMIIIPDMAKKAGETLRVEFENLIKDFIPENNEEIEKDKEGLMISETELLEQREKTNRHIRLRELLLENSKDSSLIVMTLPMPRKNTVSAPLYMAWLETLTKGMPPFLLIRGNQTSVLTFYS